MTNNAINSSEWWRQQNEIAARKRPAFDAFINHTCRCQYCSPIAEKYCQEGKQLKEIYDIWPTHDVVVIKEGEI